MNYFFFKKMFVPADFKIKKKCQFECPELVSGSIENKTKMNIEKN